MQHHLRPIAAVLVVFNAQKIKQNKSAVKNVHMTKLRKTYRPFLNQKHMSPKIQ